MPAKAARWASGWTRKFHSWGMRSRARTLRWDLMRLRGDMGGVLSLNVCRLRVHTFSRRIATFDGSRAFQGPDRTQVEPGRRVVTLETHSVATRHPDHFS